MSTYKISFTTKDRALDEAPGVVCGVDYASGPDRTGLTYLVPNEGAHEIRDAADAERLFGKYSDAHDLAMRGLDATDGRKTMVVPPTPRDACCGAPAGERHPETCPRVVEWWASRCGARPQRGQRLCFMADDFRIASGEERCVNGKDCNGDHYEPETCVRWTDRAEFVGCDACAARVDRSPGYILALDGDDWRKGILCAACATKHNGFEMVWRGNRLVRKAAAHEADDALRTRLARECTWGDRCRVATATGADLDALAEKYGLARTSPVVPKDAGPALRIFDDCGVVLAEGPVRAERTEKGARLRFDVVCATTGTASRYALIVHDVETFGGKVNDGPNALRLNTQALSSGRPIVGMLDVFGLSEWQMQALGAPAKPVFDITATMAPFTDAFTRLAASAWSASESMLHAFAPAAGFCAFVANLKAYDARERREKAKRRQSEAALVALVNAVPEALDANGWRAASIAVAESFSRLSERDRPHPEEWGQRLAMTIAHPPKEWPFPGSWMQAALAKGLDAYQRAIAPHKAPAPERRRGGKAVRLTVDDGRDE